jgi:hypothetical protein
MKLNTSFAFIVSVTVKPSAKGTVEMIRKHIRGQVKFGSATLHGCHIKAVTVVPIKES